MINIISWLKESNRWKHLLGGFFVSLITNIIFAKTTSIVIGIYCSFCCAASLELKDKQYGNKIDLIDLVLTVVGGIFGTLIYLIF